MSNTTITVNPSIPLGDISIYTFLMTFFAWVLLIITIPISQIISYNVVRNSKYNSIFKSIKIVSFMYFILIISGVVAPAVMTGVCYQNTERYYHELSDYNDQILASAQLCIITSITTVDQYADSTTKYTAVFALYNTTNPVGSFSGVCQLYDACYPPVGRSLACFDTGLNYVNTPLLANDYYVWKHRNGVGISVGFAAFIELCNLVWIYLCLCELYQLRNQLSPSGASNNMELNNSLTNKKSNKKPDGNLNSTQKYALHHNPTDNTLDSIQPAPSAPHMSLSINTPEESTQREGH